MSCAFSFLAGQDKSKTDEEKSGCRVAPTDFNRFRWYGTGVLTFFLYFLGSIILHQWGQVQAGRDKTYLDFILVPVSFVFLAGHIAMTAVRERGIKLGISKTQLALCTIGQAVWGYFHVTWLKRVYNQNRGHVGTEAGVFLCAAATSLLCLSALIRFVTMLISGNNWKTFKKLYFAVEDEDDDGFN